MNPTIDNRDGIVVVGWAEPVTLDASNVAELRERVGDINALRSRFVFDMSNLRFVDSSALGTLVGFMRRARDAGGDAKLAALPPDIATIFELTRLQQVFRIHPSVAAAVAEFNVSTR